MPRDLSGMNCDQIREAASALMDGEPSPVTQREITRHTDRCAACQEWMRLSQLITRQARMSLVSAANDLTETVMVAAAAGAQRRRREDWAVRGGLGLVAGLQLALAVPILLLGHDREAPLHVAHEMGSFDAAIAIGLIAAVKRPARAVGMLPLVGAIALLLCVTAGLDLAAGRTSFSDEAPHLLCVAGWVLLYRLAVISRDSRPTDPARISSVPNGDQAERLEPDPRFGTHLTDSGPAAHTPEAVAFDQPRRRGLTS
jgi:predicted anti-sigma-YlaC factor YlaD